MIFYIKVHNTQSVHAGKFPVIWMGFDENIVKEVGVSIYVIAFLVFYYLKSIMLSAVI